MYNIKKTYLTPAVVSVSFKPSRLIALSLNGKTEEAEGGNCTESYCEDEGSWN